MKNIYLVQPSNLTYRSVYLPYSVGTLAAYVWQFPEIAAPYRLKAFLLLTADAFSENVTECLAAGMNGHIAKPIDVKLVLKEIRRIKEEMNK